MILNIIVSAIAFVFYLQTGFFVLLKNREARVNRWFFVVSAYLAFLAVSLTLVYSVIQHDITLSLILRASWSVIPALLFRFHAFLAGVPKQTSAQDTWFFTYFFAGLLVGLFMLSTLVTIDKERLPSVTEWFWVSLIWDYLFHLLVFSNLFAIFYQYYHWRKQIAWRKERREFSFVIYSMIIPGAIYALLTLINPDMQMATFLKQPHIFLLPWFLLIAFGFTRYNFSPPDPAKAASIVLNDLRQILLFCDEQLQLKKMNAFAYQVLQHSQDEANKPDIFNVFHDKQKINSLLAEAKSSGHAGPEETTLIAADGRQIPFSISCAMLTDKFGDVYGIAFYGTDLSEIYALRDEIRRKEEVQNSLRNISNDLEGEAMKRSHEIRCSLGEAEKKMIERIKAEELIKAEIAEIEIMMGEIHTRNKKNLNIFLSLLEKTISQKLTNPEKQQVQALYQRINSILIVNTQILSHDSYGMARFKKTLELLVDSYLEGNDIPIEIKINAQDELLWIDQAVPLALVANELISNAFRHAFAGFAPDNACIQIKYRHENNIMCKLEVSDNGSGLGGIPDMNRSGYSGLYLARLLIEEQLNGSMVINRQKGTSIIASIPLDQLRRGHMGHNS